MLTENKQVPFVTKLFFVRHQADVVSLLALGHSHNITDQQYQNIQKFRTIRLQLFNSLKEAQ